MGDQPILLPLIFRVWTSRKPCGEVFIAERSPQLSVLDYGSRDVAKDSRLLGNVIPILETERTFSISLTGALSRTPFSYLRSLYENTYRGHLQNNVAISLLEDLSFANVSHDMPMARARTTCWVPLGNLRKLDEGPCVYAYPRDRLNGSLRR